MASLPRVPRLALALVAATVLAVFALLECAVELAFQNGISTWGVALGIALMGVLFLGVACVERAGHPLAQAAWTALAKSAAMAVGATCLFALAAGASFLPVSLTSRFMLGDRATDTIIYLAIGLGTLLAVNASLGALLRRRLDAAEAEAAAAERERELLQAEMAVLRAQIEPHFLWNTLAHVQYLARKNPVDAATMTGNLITYLRAAIPSARRETSTLGNELASARAYLDIMRIRMGERLHIEVGLAPELADMPFPPLIVQTLVENAIKHGVEPKVGHVTVHVGAVLDVHADGRHLHVFVIDTGVGLPVLATGDGVGMGLLSVRERLQRIYGDRATLALANRGPGGVEAMITIEL